MVNSKAGLAIILSKLKGFKNPSTKSEQYQTPSEIAATILWNAFLRDEIEGKVIFDPACGPGILGIGALLLGAKKVIFLDKDPKAIEILKENLEEKQIPETKYSIWVQDIKSVKRFACDTIIMNPPFGVQSPHADKTFLEKAFLITSVIYTFHKKESDQFVRSLAKDYGFIVAETHTFLFDLPATQLYHTKRIHKVEVSCFRLIRTAV